MKKFKPTVIEQNVFEQTVLDDIVQHVRKIGKKMDYVHDWEGPTKGKLLSERYFWSWKDHQKPTEFLLTNSTKTLLTLTNKST